MPISVGWDDETKTVVLITYQRPWTWQEFDTAIAQMLALFDTVHRQVDVIIDIRKGGFPPPDAMKRFKAAAEISHPNGGQVVYVAPGMLAQFIKSLLEILSRAFSGLSIFDVPQFMFTKSPEEARAYLAEYHKHHAKAG